MSSNDDRIFAVAEAVGRKLASQLEDLTERAAWDEVPKVMDAALDQLASTQCWGEANKLPSSVFWREAGSWLRQGSLQAHARFKPHGYAGDFEMLERLVQRDCRGEGLSLAFDQYFQAQSAPQAVRNRTQWVADQLVECVERLAGDVLVVSIGSGSAADLHLAAERLPPEQRARLRLILLDLDAAALEFAEHRLAAVIDREQFEIRRENLFRLGRRPISQHEQADFVVCTGLFDYLPDDSAVELLAWMSRLRASRGRLAMMNFSPRNGSRAYMEWAGTWHLIHRTEQQMHELAERADSSIEWQLGAEPLGIDWILESK